MKLAIAQTNATIGDFAGNTERVIGFATRARDAGCALVLFPELALCGYPPMDLLDYAGFTGGNRRALDVLCRRLPAEIACGIGYVGRNMRGRGKHLVNMYGVVKNGSLVFEQAKTLLPTYDVFDEARNFEPAREWNVFELDGERIGFAICEDLWRETETPGTRYDSDPVGRLLEAGLTLLCVPSASPYSLSKYETRLSLARRVGERGRIPLVYINAVGANDSIIFDGRSFALPPGGEPLTAPAMEESLLIYQTGAPLQNAQARPQPQELDTLEDALVMGIRDYMRKCGFSRCHLGLSGGIDSALVACLAARAAGPENVRVFRMPSRFSSQGSKDDAQELAARLGLRCDTLPIEPLFSAFLTALEGVFEQRPFDIAEENLQARIRGTLMMAYSNKFSSMLLATGNKSELAMGYCTLYGDMNGALCPIGDLFKTEVFALCERINEKARSKDGRNLIPQEILDKPPSAELRPNQKDEDSLPPYAVLDDILKLYLFDNLSADEIAARGIDRTLAAEITGKTARAEFKRRQAPPVLKVSPRAFGMGRRMPIARALYETLP